MHAHCHRRMQLWCADRRFAPGRRSADGALINARVALAVSGRRLRSGLALLLLLLLRLAQRHALHLLQRQVVPRRLRAAVAVVQAHVRAPPVLRSAQRLFRQLQWAPYYTCMHACALTDWCFKP